MSKIVIEEILNLLAGIFIWCKIQRMGRHVFLCSCGNHQCWKKCRKYQSWEEWLWWVLHSSVTGHVVRAELCPFWFFHWKTACERFLLTQHLVQWGLGSYQRSHKGAQSTVLLWGKALTSVVFAHICSFFCDFECNLVQNTCKMTLSKLLFYENVASLF